MYIKSPPDGAEHKDQDQSHEISTKWVQNLKQKSIIYVCINQYYILNIINLSIKQSVCSSNEYIWTQTFINM